VRKFVREREIQEQIYVRHNRYYPSLGKYIEEVNRILESENTAIKKRSFQSIYDEIRDSGFKGSYSSVCRYVKRMQGEKAKITDAYIPLVFAPGEAYQFDWSTEYVEINGEVVKVKVAHFVLCYSRYKFIYAYPCETQEMLFDAHARALEYFGGVPKCGIYDNMKTAVKKILRGKARDWNPAFEQQCSHYRIEPVACNPASGWEKGRVERQVEIARGKFFLPMPKVKSLAELNQILSSRITAYNRTHKHPQEKSKTLAEVYQLELPSLAKLPIPFVGARCRDIKISSTCLAMFDKNQYSVDCQYAGKIVQCKAYADRLVFIHQGKKIAEHERRFSRDQTYYDWQHYLPLLMRKPGALKNGAPFQGMGLPEELHLVRQHLQKQSATGARNFVQILSYIPQMSIEAVQAACRQAIQNQTISADIILNILLRSKEEPAEESHVVSEYLILKCNPISDCSRYNTLLKGVTVC